MLWSSAVPDADTPSFGTLLKERFERQLRVLQQQGYMVPVEDPEADSAFGLDEAMKAVEKVKSKEDFEWVKGVIETLHADGHLSKIHFYSCLSILCDNPAIAMHDEAERYNVLMEADARKENGPALNKHLASVERHRGSGWFCRGDAWASRHAESPANSARARECYLNALKHYQNAADFVFESPQNQQNVLAALVRIDPEESRAHWERIQTKLQPSIVEKIKSLIFTDPCLMSLRIPVVENTPEKE